MNVLYFIIEIIGVFIFIGICIAISKDKKNIPWVSIVVLLTLNLAIACFFLLVPVGHEVLMAVIDGFTQVIQTANQGIEFVFSDSLTSTSSQITQGIKSAVFFASALLPIIVIVPFFDILTYIGVLPFIIRYVGAGLAFITRQHKYESFFAIMMMFLGNTEAIASTRFQLETFKGKQEARVVTIAMMSMSCVTAALIGAYCTMMPGEYILTAIPLNVINALMVTSIINPVKVPKDKDIVVDLYKKGEKREPFFSFLGNSILNAGQLVLIIAANVIAFVGLAALANLLLGLFNPLIHMFIDWDLSLENILGLIMYLPACLLGVPFGSPEAMQLAQSMGTKFVTNEFVVMGQLSPIITSPEFSEHFRCVTTVFLTSFANFSTVGMIIGCLKDYKEVPKNVPYIFVSGIMVSLMSAVIAGLFVW